MKLLILQQEHVRPPVVLAGDEPARVHAEALDELREDVDSRSLGSLLHDVAKLIRIDIEVACRRRQITVEPAMEKSGDTGREIARVETGHGRSTPCTPRRSAGRKRGTHRDTGHSS